jgi:aryl-alcohol dehydrogenase-like predicted oxidoreductase
MEMRELGGMGMRASVIGLGCNNFGIYQDAKQAGAAGHADGQDRPECMQSLPA